MGRSSRLCNRISSPSRNTSVRKPSHLGSNCQPSPPGNASPALDSMGATGGAKGRRMSHPNALLTSVNSCKVGALTHLPTRGGTIMNRPRRSCAPLFGSIALLLVAVLLPDLATAQTPKRGGTLRVAYGNEILGMDFYTTPGYEMVWFATNVGCGLVIITPDGKFFPDAAESSQISSDGLRYTFKLRKNVLFHDSINVDA